MESALVELLLAGLVVYLLAGTIKGVIGLGLPTAGIGIMSQFTEPLNAIALAIVPMVVTNLWQIYRCGFVLRTIGRYWPYCLMLSVFIWYSSAYAAQIPASILQICVGTAVALFALDALWRKPFKLNPRFDLPVQLGAGTLGGLMGGIAGIWSPTMVPYLLARQVEKDEFVRALGFMIFTGSLFLCIGYVQSGVLHSSMARVSALMVIPALLGFSLGEVIRKRLGGERFRKVVLLFFILMGLNLIRRGLW